MYKMFKKFFFISCNFEKILKAIAFIIPIDSLYISEKVTKISPHKCTLLLKELILQTIVSGNYTKNMLTKYIKYVYDLCIPGISFEPLLTV